MNKKFKLIDDVEVSCNFEALEDQLLELQELVDELRQTELRYYVDSRKLGSVDCHFALLDKLLTLGVLQ